MLRAHHFIAKLAGSSQSKQLWIELLYRYRRAKTSRITLLNIRKLYLYLFEDIENMFTLGHSVERTNSRALISILVDFLSLGFRPNCPTAQSAPGPKIVLW